MRQEVRFCHAADGTRLAYTTLGQGPPLVKAAHWLPHLEHEIRWPAWLHWLHELSRDHTLVRYDERGCGLSRTRSRHGPGAAYTILYDGHPAPPRGSPPMG